MTVAGHIGRFAFHKAAADHIKSVGGASSAWEGVVLFYAALHVVDAYLTHKKRKRKTHTERWQEINNKALPELSSQRSRAFRVSYKRLQDLSEDIRYEPDSSPASSEFVQARSDLAIVEGHLMPRLSSYPVPGSPPSVPVPTAAAEPIESMTSEPTPEPGDSTTGETDK